MYGSSGDYLKKVLEGTSLSIDYMHDEFNPSFGGRNPEPLEDNLKDCISRVVNEGYELGIALDGDGDRIAMVTKTGEYIDAQVLLPLIAVHMIENRKEKGGIAKTVVGSNLIDRVAGDFGVRLFETPVGFSIFRIF